MFPDCTRCISRFTEYLADRLCISRFTEYLADRLCISRFTEYLADRLCISRFTENLADRLCTTLPQRIMEAEQTPLVEDNWSSRGLCSTSMIVSGSVAALNSFKQFSRYVFTPATAGLRWPQQQWQVCGPLLLLVLVVRSETTSSTQPSSEADGKNYQVKP